jgi:hypothetical protein
VEPGGARKGAAREDDLGPQPPPFVVPLKGRGRAVRHDETEDGTDTGCARISVETSIRSGATHTVSRVEAKRILNLWWSRTVMVVAHAAKKRSMCQHRKRAVASRALKNEAPGRRRGANLLSDQALRGHKKRKDGRVGCSGESLVGDRLCALEGVLVSTKVVVVHSKGGERGYDEPAFALRCGGTEGSSLFRRQFAFMPEAQAKRLMGKLRTADPPCVNHNNTDPLPVSVSPETDARRMSSHSSIPSIPPLRRMRAAVTRINVA